MSRGQTDIFHFPKERVSSGDKFRCRKCRTYLFSFDNLTSFHKKIEPVDQCSAWYLGCDDDGLDLPWIRDAIDKSDWTEGKIYCTKCTSRIGAFSITQGVKCSCFAYVIPAVWIQKSKVDQVTIADSKPNIRLPRQPGNNNGNDDNHDLPNTQTGLQTSQTSMQTCQTGSQTFQTTSNSGQTGLQFQTGLPVSHRCTDQSSVQTSQTSMQTDKTCIQTCQAGLSKADNCGNQPTKSSQTSLMRSNDVNSEPGTSVLCSCTFTRNRHSNPVNSHKGFQLHTVYHRCVLQGCLSSVQGSQESDLSSCSQSENVQPMQLCSHSVNAPQGISMANPCRCRLAAGRERSHYQIVTDGNSTVCKRNKRTLRKRRKQADCSDDERTSHDWHTEFNDVVGTGKTNQEKERTEENENIPEHLICPICLDLLYEPFLSPCDHVFCDSCLRLLNSKCHKSVPRCPLCRKSMNYVYPAVELREEIRKTHPDMYRKRHWTEQRAPHRRLPLPSRRLKSRQKTSNHFQNAPMPYSVLVFLVCVLTICVLCLVILFVFCPPTSNRCITVIDYE